jgi:hypothetical protein
MAMVRGSGTGAKATIGSRVKKVVTSAKKTYKLGTTPVKKVVKPKAVKPKGTTTGLNVAKKLKSRTASTNRSLGY